MRSALSIDVSKAALLCFDLQEEHRSDSRYLVEGYDRVLDNVRRLQGVARQAGPPVLHVAYVIDPSRPVRAFHPLTPDGRSAFSDVGDPLSELCGEVGPAGAETVLVKDDSSAFSRMEFETALRQRRIDTLFVTGVWTEACIAATVGDALARGFRVVLVKDACGSGSRAMHETAVLNLANRLYGGAVTDTEGACRLMAGETVAAWQVRDPVPLRFTYENAACLYGEL